eukprot:TRINITY_DN4202_c0_g1_i3.p1 TRINITY_DN4202_c0_g1~~TRINITY_DN4202_c0_g1_i3.p1  ORF type:complete len:300 (-),score=32.99 TRINITY_DN4202_c0_g1_i3:46-945(-)
MVPALAQEADAQVDITTWTRVAAHMVCTAPDDDERTAAVAWLSQQVRAWPVWFRTYLCHCAAQGGQLAALNFLVRDDHGQALFGPLVWDLSRVDSSSHPWATALSQHFTVYCGPTWAGHICTLMDRAAAGGSVEVLRWLHQEHDLPLTPFTMRFAADGGRLSALQWLHQAGCPCDIDGLCRKSLGAPLRVTPEQMEWLRSVGGSWSRETLSNTLKGLVGHLPAKDMIRWLRREGAEWPQLAAAVDDYYHDEDGAEAILWAAREGCPWGDWTPRCCALVSRERYSIKRALHGAGCPCQCC